MTASVVAVIANCTTIKHLASEGTILSSSHFSFLIAALIDCVYALHLCSHLSTTAAFQVQMALP